MLHWYCFVCQLLPVDLRRAGYAATELRRRDVVVSHVSGTEQLCRRHVPVGQDIETELKRSL